MAVASSPRPSTAHSSSRSEKSPRLFTGKFQLPVRCGQSHEFGAYPAVDPHISGDPLAAIIDSLLSLRIISTKMFLVLASPAQ